MQKIGKEVKIGLAVIGVLAVAFGAVLVRRLTHHDEPTNVAAAVDGNGAKTADAGGKASKPTIISATDGADAAPPESKRRLWSMGARGGADAAAGDSDSVGDDRVAPKPLPTDEPFKSARRGAQRMPATETAGDDAVADRDARPRDAAAEADRRAGGFFARGDRAGADSGDPAGQAAEKAPRSVERELRGDDDAKARLAALTADNAAPADPFARRASNDSPAPADSTAGKTPDLPANAFSQRFGGDKTAAPQAPPTPTGAPGDQPAADNGLTPPGGSFKFDPNVSLPKKTLPAATIGDAGPTSPTPTTTDDPNPLRRPNQFGAPPGNSALPVNVNPPNRFTGPTSPTTIDPSPVNPQPRTISPGDASAVTPSALNTPAPLRPLNPSTGSVAPAQDKPGQYTVQPNDNYWTISEKVYGTGGYFKAIFEYNRRQHPQAQRLQVGEVLAVPDVDTLQKNYPDLCPKPGRPATTAPAAAPASARVRPGTRIYTVDEGDTLYEIARKQLGKPSRWAEVYQLNRDTLGTDFDYLKPGTELLLPTDGGAVSQQPTGTFPR